MCRGSRRDRLSAPRMTPGHEGITQPSVIAVTAVTRGPIGTLRRPQGPSGTSPAFECRTNRPIGPISIVLVPLSAYLSLFGDRQVTDHDGDATDRSPTVRGDRRGNGRDRYAADHQKGLSKPNVNAVGMVIGPIGASRSQRKRSRRPKPPLPHRSYPCPWASACNSVYSFWYLALRLPAAFLTRCCGAPGDGPVHRRQVGGVPRGAILGEILQPPVEDIRTGTPRRRQRPAPKLAFLLK